MVSVERTGEKDRILFMFILQDRELRFRMEEVMPVLPPLLTIPAFVLEPSALPSAVLPDGDEVEFAVALAPRRDIAKTESLLLCKKRFTVA